MNFGNWSIQAGSIVIPGAEEVRATVWSIWAETTLDPRPSWVRNSRIGVRKHRLQCESLHRTYAMGLVYIV